MLVICCAQSVSIFHAVQFCATIEVHYQDFILNVIFDVVLDIRWHPETSTQFFVTLVVHSSIYHVVVKIDLNWCSHFNKLLCIKGIVFVIF